MANGSAEQVFGPFFLAAWRARLDPDVLLPAVQEIIT
jgi:hypothetical protein